MVKLTGFSTYKIDLNGESYKTNQSQITLTLKEGLNDLTVKTEADCQGIYEDKILVSTSQIYFTNPVTNELKIEGDFIGKPISYSLVSSSAQRIIEKSFQATENSIVIPMANLSDGIYFFTINYSAKTEQLKIIKQ